MHEITSTQPIIDIKNKKSLKKIQGIYKLLQEVSHKFDILLDNKKVKRVKGSNCSINGTNYEKKILNTIKNMLYNGKVFTEQTEYDLAGSTCKNDLECKLNDKNIGIEAKKYNSPDWMQCSLKYISGKWKGSENGKIRV